MNRALCFMPGILPCASFTLHKPLGLPLICFPRVQRFGNLDTRKKERGRQKRQEIKAQSELTGGESQSALIRGLSSVTLTPSAQVLGLVGDCFPPSDCVKEEAAASMVLHRHMCFISWIPCIVSACRCWLGTCSLELFPFLKRTFFCPGLLPSGDLSTLLLLWRTIKSY